MHDKQLGSSPIELLTIEHIPKIWTFFRSTRSPSADEAAQLLLALHAAAFLYWREYMRFTETASIKETKEYVRKLHAAVKVLRMLVNQDPESLRHELFEEEDKQFRLSDWKKLNRDLTTLEQLLQRGKSELNSIKNSKRRAERSARGIYAQEMIKIFRRFAPKNVSHHTVSHGGDNKLSGAFPAFLEHVGCMVLGSKLSFTDPARQAGRDFDKGDIF